MPSPPKPSGSRHRRNGGAPGRAPLTTVTGAGVAAAAVPKPPASLPRSLHPAYRRVWREAAVAEAWPSEARELVARLVVLRDRVARLGDEATGAMYSSLLGLERELLLTPRAARSSGLVLEPSLPAAARKLLPSNEFLADGRAVARARLGDRDRERVLAAVRASAATGSAA